MWAKVNSTILNEIHEYLLISINDWINVEERNLLKNCKLIVYILPPQRWSLIPTSGVWDELSDLLQRVEHGKGWTETLQRRNLADTTSASWSRLTPSVLSCWDHVPLIYCDKNGPSPLWFSSQEPITPTYAWEKHPWNSGDVRKSKPVQ